MPGMAGRINRRHMVLWLAACAGLLALGALPAAGRALGAGHDARAGLSVTQRGGAVDLVSAGRFALTIDGAGVSAWYNLRKDPARRENLVAPGGALLEHLAAGARVPAGARPVVLQHSEVRARVRLDDGATAVDYTVWAGGQVAVELRSAAGVTMALRRRAASITGAALQAEAPAIDAAGRTVQRATLYLDAWTGEERAGIAPAGLYAPAAAVPGAYSGAFSADAAGASALTITLPEQLGVRQPRFLVAGWPSAALTVRRGDVVLVAGADYLADWDAASGELAVQYLHLLPPGDERSFTLSTTIQAPAIRLGVAGRDIDERGLLTVDANLPSYGGTPTAQDVFKIPYIQTAPVVEATAVVQEAPAGARVRFVLDDAHEQIDAAAPFAASFTLEARGEHRLRAELLDQGGTVLAASQISPLGYGEILVAIGDSITTGVGGYQVSSTGAHDSGPPRIAYPITRAEQSPLASADARDFYQADNWAHTVTEPYYPSFHIKLNDELAGCAATPVFILNDGFSGVRTGRNRNDGQPTTQNNNLLQKMPAYRDHIATLGAQQVLLTVGTNDVSGALPASTWASDLNQVIDALQQDSVDLAIWVGRLAWRDDKAGAAELTASYNALIPGIVSAQNQASAPVLLGPDFFAYTENKLALFATDRLHPAQEGYDGMAGLWRDATCKALQVTPPPTTPPTTPEPTYDQTVLLPRIER